MRKPFVHRVLVFAAVVALIALGVFGAVACIFGPDQSIVWVCLNPETGKLDDAPYDETHVGVNGEADPCHCYDPCGPLKSCPIVVDAGELGPECDAGDGG